MIFLNECVDYFKTNVKRNHSVEVVCEFVQVEDLRKEGSVADKYHTKN